MHAPANALSAFLAAFLVACTSTTLAGETPRYVGLGRYTCSGSTERCVIVRQNNDAVEARRDAKQVFDRLEADASRIESEARQRRFRDTLEAGKK